MKDPFTPTFGKTPPRLAGRDHVLSEWAYALDQGPGAFGRAALVTGARGAGKTVMLNAFEDLARERQWLVISETATDGLLDRLTTQRIPEVLDEIDPGGGRRRELLGVTLPAWLGGGGITTSVKDARSERKPDLRSSLNALFRLLPVEQGVVITVDEVNTELREELRQITAVVQHGFREGRELAFVAAGLPSSVSSLLSDRPLTFLRRAQRHVLGALPDYAVSDALAVPAKEAGLPFNREGLAAAVAAAQGYPFLAQLIGSRSFMAALQKKRAEIDARVVEQALSAARSILMQNVHETAMVQVPDGERRYLYAMALDDGDSRTGAIAKRLGVSAQHANVLRTRLLDEGIIEAPERGVVRFALPLMREYLVHSAAERGDEFVPSSDE